MKLFYNALLKPIVFVFVLAFSVNAQNKAGMIDNLISEYSALGLGIPLRTAAG